MERRRRDFKNPKLAESGKPDLKMPLSTMAKFRGGASISSPPLPSPSAVAGDSCGGGVEIPPANDPEASLAIINLFPLEMSNVMILAPKSRTEEMQLKERERIVQHRSIESVVLELRS